MPKIPEGAKVPQDKKPPQIELIKPGETPDGWDLLRDPMDVEYWEQADLIAAVAQIKTRGDVIEITAKALGTIGQVARLLQTVFAVDSNGFREWIRAQGSFENATTVLLPLTFAYVNALGEADSSAS